MKPIKRLLIALSTLAAFVCSFLFYDMYLKRSFSQTGSHFDPTEGVVYNEQSFVWGILAVIFFIPLVRALFINRS